MIKRNVFKIAGPALIQEALNNPGVLSKCYSVFRNYSVMNGLALAMQCRKRGLDVGPCASFKKWGELGGKVNKGEKALWVCVPMLVKKHKEESPKEDEKDESFMFFSWKPCVFTLAQVSGVEQSALPPAVGSWSIENVISSLNIPVLPWNSTDGNAQGYATQEGVALNPLGKHKVRTFAHEAAHYLMHFKDKADKETKEVEAELVSYIVGASLELPGEEESRGYIQHWLGNNELSQKSAMRVLACANKILRGGEQPCHK